MKRVHAPAETRRPLRALLAGTLATAVAALAICLAAPAIAHDPVPSQDLTDAIALLNRESQAADASLASGSVQTREGFALASTPLPEGVTTTSRITNESTFEFTLDEPDLIAIRVTASGPTTDEDSVVGLYSLAQGSTTIDTMTVFEGQPEESWFVLPEGTYTLDFLTIGANAARDVSWYWRGFDLGLEPGQATLPSNRSFDNAEPILTDTQVHGIFYWGYAAADPTTNVDGHFYEFELTRPANVTLNLGTTGIAQVALMDDSSSVAEDANGTPIAASGTGTMSVDCGTLDAGTYRMLVISSDASSWNHQYKAEVYTNPIDDTEVLTANVYRVYNESTGEHLYTEDWDERDALIESGWRDEDVAWVAPTYSDMPVWRLLNPYTSEHLYTKDANEHMTLTEAGWQDEGVVWFSDGPQGRPVYRLFNPYAPAASAHHFTTDVNEYQVLGEQGWSQEGESWYGLQ